MRKLILCLIAAVCIPLAVIAVPKPPPASADVYEPRYWNETPPTTPTGYAGEVMADNPMAYWRFEEPAGSTVFADATGRAPVTFLASSFGGGFFEAGRTGTVGKALFNEGGESSFANPQALWPTTNAVTIESWVRFADRVGNPGSDATRDAIFEWNPDGYGLIKEKDGGGLCAIAKVVNYQQTVTCNAPAQTLATDGEWHHLAMTAQTGGELAVWLDAIKVASTAIPSNGLDPNGGVPYVASGPWYAFSLLRGFVDEMAVYDRVLAPDRLASHVISGQSFPGIPSGSPLGSGGGGSSGHSLVKSNGDWVYMKGKNNKGQLCRSNTLDVTNWTAGWLPQATVSVATGSAHTLALQSSGRLYVCGDNAYGQLGTGINVGGYSTASILLDKIGDVTSVAAGENHSVAAIFNGRVFTWGLNDRGQLGTGNLNNSSVPVAIRGLSRVVQVTAGAKATYALTDTGAVYAWGANDKGQLGDNTTTDRLAPVLVKTGIKQISAGSEHVTALSRSGKVFTWGYNGFGNLGLGDTTNRPAPTQVTSLANTAVAHIAAGGSSTAAWSNSSSGSNHLWGSNWCGELGLGQSAPVAVMSPTRMTALIGDIAFGNCTSVMTLADDTIYQSGRLWPTTTKVREPQNQNIILSSENMGLHMQLLAKRQTREEGQRRDERTKVVVPPLPALSEAFGFQYPTVDPRTWPTELVTRSDAVNQATTVNQYSATTKMLAFPLAPFTWMNLDVPNAVTAAAAPFSTYFQWSGHGIDVPEYDGGPLKFTALYHSSELPPLGSPFMDRPNSFLVPKAEDCQGGALEAELTRRLIDTGGDSYCMPLPFLGFNPYGNRLAIFAACCTASPGTSGKSFLDAAVGQGADVAIGWNVLLDDPWAKVWTLRFWEHYTAGGQTVQQSIDFATAYANSTYGSSRCNKGTAPCTPIVKTRNNDSSYLLRTHDLFK